MLLITMVTYSMFQLSCKKAETLQSESPGSSLKKIDLANANSLTSNADLIAYKNTVHEITMGYYRTWRDRTVSGNANDPIMTDLPDSLDMVSVFTNFTPDTSPYWTALKDTYVPYLHSKGTKVIVTGGYFTGASTNAAGLATWVQGVRDNIAKYNYDGYDIDIESTDSGVKLQDQIATFQALSQYLGPLSGTGKLLIYDTNQNGNALMNGIKNMVSYVFLQAYGRGASTLQNTWNTFSPYISSTKFVVGFSFYEENGAPSNVWYDVTYPQNGTGRAYDYARWEPSSGKKGGVLSYAIDRDAPLTSATDNTIRTANFRVTNDIIKLMNPGGPVAPSTDGVTFYADASYAGTASQKLTKGTYTLAQLAAKGVVNDWASSVQIPAGWKVIMYADNNFTGTSWTLTSSNSWFGALSPSANDKMSSVKIQ